MCERERNILTHPKMETEDYEYVRNLTILFFLEKLLDKGESRSLHDLSCQFGTKGFSKEMRQIAGGSKAGLKKFLLEYPSLFAVQDDQVSVAKVSVADDVDGSGGPKRDYGHEAMLYFKDKLVQYGEGIEVPIKSLLGHRSQAPPQVRHVSGQHFKEFSDFLARFPEEFVVGEETIYLKQYEGTVMRKYCEQPEGQDDDDDDEEGGGAGVGPRVGHKAVNEELKNNIVKYLKSCLSDNDPDPTNLDELFNDVMDNFSTDHELPFRTVLDLRTFLKMYPQHFQVQGKLVELAVTVSKSSLNNGPNSNSNTNTNNNNIAVGANSNDGTPRARRSKADGMSFNPMASLKDRINSVVKQVVADNTFKERADAPRFDYQTWCSNVIQSAKIIRSVEEGRSLCENILKSHDVVALDVKGMNLGVEGRITSIHLNTMDCSPLVFDLITLPTLLTEGRLKDVLETDRIVKAAYAVLQYQEDLSPVYKVKNTSLSSLCKLYKISGHEMIEQNRSTYKRDQKFWTRRPFDQEMILVLASDLLALVPQLYATMKRQILDSHMELFNDLCEEQVMLYVDPENVKERKKQRKIELEIEDIKQKLSTANGKNIVLSNREIRLLRYIELTEESKNLIKGSAKVAKKLERLTSKPDNDDPEDNNAGSNPPSLESVSSGLSSDNSANSPMHSTVDGKSSVLMGRALSANSVNDIIMPGRTQEIDRIEKLEAMIANISKFGGSTENIALRAPFQPQTTAFTKPAVVVEKRSVETQTVSTGDIVITKVYSSE
ncbi:hypothetical protein TCAL_01651 [Tigriopus californicus]|uniref:Egal-1 winged helix domain-containing protein n=1 Tax=Tigriopus californicus TaxID=6832 RepID=A0A553PC96_TIGCA|nr:hypothetical protein TCAL_01651 [Tigriopus californicus]